MLVIKDFQFSNHAKSKPKFFVLLNATSYSETVIYMLPTTQTQHYQSRRKDNLYFELKLKESKCFNKPNVFDFNQIEPMPYEDFEAMYNHVDTQYNGCLEPHIVAKIDKYVRKCKTLSDEHKRIILGEDFSG